MVVKNSDYTPPTGSSRSESSSASYSLASALRDVMDAAIEADAQAAQSSYEKIKEFAYNLDEGNGRMRRAVRGNTSSLAMAAFTMRNSQGRYQEVAIPQISMMPLPLLQIKEVQFDMEFSMQIQQQQSGSLSETNSGRPIMVVGSASPSNNPDGSSTTHMRVTVKMGQSDIPGGIKLLLQSAANGLMVNEVGNETIE